MNSTIMKAELAAYWRFTRQSPLVALEALHEDVLVVSPSGRLVICEIKISANDMRQDRFKPRHAFIRKHLGLPLLDGMRPAHSDGLSPTAFYFAVPDTLSAKANEIREEFYPYAGLIALKEGNRYFRGHLVLVTHDAKRLHNRKCTPVALGHLVKAQSASLANAYSKLAKETEGAA